MTYFWIIFFGAITLSFDVGSNLLKQTEMQQVKLQTETDVAINALFIKHQQTTTSHHESPTHTKGNIQYKIPSSVKIIQCIDNDNQLNSYIETDAEYDTPIKNYKTKNVELKKLSSIVKSKKGYILTSKIEIQKINFPQCQWGNKRSQQR